MIGGMQLKQKLDPAVTALVVVDMQNDFCAPTGVMGQMGKDVSAMPDMVKGIQSLADVCEAKGVPVLFTQQIYDRSKLNDLQKEQYDLDGKLITCDIAGDGWQFFGFEPPAERVFPKYNYNIFSNPDLCNLLAEKGIKTLIITGVSTQICVETAMRNGFDLGYKIVVPADLVATTSKDSETQNRTLNLVRKTYGVVSSHQEIVEILERYS